MSSSLLSPPSQAWETVPELTGTAAENSEMLLQGRKVEVLPPDTSGDYTGGAGEKAQHFRTPTVPGEDHLWASQHPHWEAHSPH